VGEKLGHIEIDDLVARGIYDPTAPDAQARRLSLAAAIRVGATIEDLVEYSDNLATFTTGVLLRPGRERLTLAEAADRANLPIEKALALNRVSGFADPKPDDAIFDEHDVEIFAGFSGAAEVFGEDLVMQLTRVMGSAMARIADAMVSVFATNVGTRSQQGAMDDLEIARTNELAISVLPSAVQTMHVLLRRHIQARSRPDLLLGEDWQGVDALERAVGFCDLVGYTALTEQLTIAKVAEVVARFESRASDLVTALGGNVVKLIGDEVMYVAPNAPAGIEIALGLVDAFDTDDLPPVRVGLSAGTVLLREGDYYGPLVNLAARLVKLAPPGTVLAPATFRDLVPGIDFEDAGRPELKGFEEPVALVAIRRA
jgi:class 3 adenylate cyclase